LNLFLQEAWARRGWRAVLLWPLSRLYALVILTRRQLFASGIFTSSRFDRPVVVVGNVIAGGAGKTPLVIALVRHLGKQGLKVGIVSRGHGRTSEGPMQVTPQTSAYASGDEPALINRATGAPVFVAKKRASAVNSLLSTYPDTEVVIADDGLQHYAMSRDLDVIVFDDRGAGNGWLLPAGPLREPWPRQSLAKSLVLHTGMKPAFAGLRSSRTLAETAYAADGRQVALVALQGRPIAALAAIANPETFFSMLRSAGLNLEITRAWPDHHSFTDFDARPFKGKTVLCTEKDAVKLFGMPHAQELDLFAVPLEFSPEPAFFEAFDAALARIRSTLPSADGHQTS
jgi:tetraacyldisaccharide 4'-kinase